MCTASLATAGAPGGYRAGVGGLDSSGIRVEAIAIEDTRGARAVLVRINAQLSRTAADLAGARAEKEYSLPRACLALESVASGEVASGQLADMLFLVAGAALGDLQPARLSFSARALVITTPEGKPRAAFPEAASGPSRPASGPIRCAFRILDAQTGLAGREDAAGPQRASYWAQAIRFGNAVTLAALAGDLPEGYAERAAAQFGSPAEPVLVIGRANGDAAFDAALAADGLQSVLARVGRRIRRQAGSAR